MKPTYTADDIPVFLPCQVLFHRVSW